METSMNGNGTHSGFAPPDAQMAADLQQGMREAISALDKAAAAAETGTGAAPAGTPTRVLSLDGDPLYRYSALLNTSDTVRLDGVMALLQEAYGASHCVEVAQIKGHYAIALDGVKTAQAAQAQYSREQRRREARAQKKAAQALKRNADILKAQEAASASLRAELMTVQAKLQEVMLSAADLTGASAQTDTPYDPAMPGPCGPQPLEADEAAGRGRVARQEGDSSEESPLTLLAILITGSVLGLSIGRDLTLITSSLNTVFEQGMAPYFCAGLGIAATYLVKQGLFRISSLAALKADLAVNAFQRAAAYLPLALASGTLVAVEMSVIRASLLMNPFLNGKTGDVSLWLVSLPLLLPAMLSGIGEGVNQGAARAADLKTCDLRKREQEARIQEVLANPAYQSMIGERGKVKAYALRAHQLLADIERVEAPYHLLQRWEDAELEYPKELTAAQNGRINELLYDATHAIRILRDLLERFLQQIQSERRQGTPINQYNNQTTVNLFSQAPPSKTSWWRRLADRFRRKNRE